VSDQNRSAGLAAVTCRRTDGARNAPRRLMVSNIHIVPREPRTCLVNEAITECLQQIFIHYLYISSYFHISKMFIISLQLATDWTAGVRFLARDFCLYHSYQTGSGVHPASYPMRTGGSFPGGKAARERSPPLPSSQCQGQEWRSYTSTIPHVFMAQRLIN
jgi:hypothetical protein